MVQLLGARPRRETRLYTGGKENVAFVGNKDPGCAWGHSRGVEQTGALSVPGFMGSASFFVRKESVTCPAGGP